MVNLKPYYAEILFAVGTFFFLLFVTTNANTSLGTTYLQFLFGAIILLLINLLVFDKRVQVTLKKNNTSNIEEFFIGAVGWIGLMIISYLILNFVEPGTTIGSIMNSLNAANPVFSNSVIINFIVIALAIPFAETVLWGRGAEFLADRFGVKISKTNKFAFGFVAIALALSALFSIFHATAKQLAGQSLFIVFIMMAISIYLIAERDGDMRAAVFLHVLANGVAAALLIAGGSGLAI